MKRMAELVEERVGVVEGEQARLALRRLGEVADVDRDRAHHAVELVWPRKDEHQAPERFEEPGEIVADEDAHVPVAAPDLPGAGVGVIERHVEAGGSSARTGGPPRRRRPR